ncbi:hypothetical protein D3C80_517680 [compost metagenome]
MFRELRVGFSRSLRSGPVAETPKTYYITYVYRRWEDSGHLHHRLLKPSNGQGAQVLCYQR